MNTEFYVFYGVGVVGFYVSDMFSFIPRLQFQCVILQVMQRHTHSHTYGILLNGSHYRCVFT